MVGATDANGGATVTIPILPLPQLVGLRFHVAALTIDPTQPLGIGNVSNEQAFVVR